jgi:type VI protein secretion system component VasF
MPHLCAACRRAKRLKKLVRLLTGSAAQSTTLRFYQHTWVLVLLAIVAHVACFIALTLEINSRYE